MHFLAVIGVGVFRVRDRAGTECFWGVLGASQNMANSVGAPRRNARAAMRPRRTIAVTVRCPIRVCASKSTVALSSYLIYNVVAGSVGVEFYGRRL